MHARGVLDADRMTDLPKELRVSSRRSGMDRAIEIARRAALGGRHAQAPRAPRRRRHGRDGAHPGVSGGKSDLPSPVARSRGGRRRGRRGRTTRRKTKRDAGGSTAGRARHPVHLDPGRLRDGLRLLRERRRGAQAPPRRRRDRRRRCSSAARASTRTSASATSSTWEWASRSTTTKRRRARCGCSRTARASPSRRGGSRSRRAASSRRSRGSGRTSRATSASPSRCTRPTTRRARASCPSTRSTRCRVLMDALRAYPLPRRRRITIEYTLVAGQNDAVGRGEEAREAPPGLPVKVNLIPMNPIAASPLGPPKIAGVLEFQQVLCDAGYSCFIRKRRGDDVSAACGQLAPARREAQGAREPLVIEVSSPFMVPYIHVPDLHIGPLPLHPFGILVATGVLVGTSITARRAQKLGYDVVQLNSFVTWMLVSAFVLSHVLDSLFYHWDEVDSEPAVRLHALGGAELLRRLRGRGHRHRPLEVLRHRRRQGVAPQASRARPRSFRSPTWSSRCFRSAGPSGAPAARPSTITRERAPRPTRCSRSRTRRHAGDGTVTKFGFIEFIQGHDPRFDLGLSRAPLHHHPGDLLRADVAAAPRPSARTSSRRASRTRRCGSPWTSCASRRANVAATRATAG